MTFEIAHAQDFPMELALVPKKVKGAYRSIVTGVLVTEPDRPAPPRVKRLEGYRDLWRLRVADTYRLVYRVEREHRRVTLLMVGHRNSIYDRLGAAADGKPGVRIVATASELLERVPTPEEVGTALIQHAESPEEALPAPDEPLPMALADELLEEWNIPIQYRPHLREATTSEQLLALGGRVPAPILERVLGGLFPKKVEEVVQKPVRVADAPEDIERAADGEIGLDAFLLRLDAEQEAFVARFKVSQAQGPWLVKGGPGSGKSTVAIYCARAIHEHARPAGAGGPPPKVLFTTFTKSLVQASRHLLGAIPGDGAAGSGGGSVDVQNIDAIAFRILDPAERRTDIAKAPEQRAACQETIRALRARGPGFSFDESDVEFLIEEFDWVIVGQGLGRVEEYLEADRSGRRRPLGVAQRREAWMVYEEFRRRLRGRNLVMFSERLAAACARATPRYDYVFVDEAQDLKPTAIRLCVRLCREPSRIFLAADPNQSIYGSGMSWSTVSSALRFTGKARVLKRNYRTTREIWRAVQQLAPEGESTDRETLEAEPVYSGPHPAYLGLRRAADLREHLNSFLFEAIAAERLSPGCAAVLCHSKRDVELMASLVDARLRPKAMASGDFDLGHPGVKIMTMHSSKGLQFPVVAITGLDEDRFPGPAPSPALRPEHVDRQRRLLFVACTRAVRRLKLFGSLDRPSSLVEGITEEHWDVEGN